MKKLLSLGILCASLAVAPLVANAEPVKEIDGSIGVGLNFSGSGSSLSGITSFTWSTAQTQAGKVDYSSVPVGTSVTGDTTIYLTAGHEGGAASNGSTPFTFDLGTLGTFTATGDVFDFIGNSSFAGWSIDGFFTPAGALATAGYTETSAILAFAVTNSGTTDTGSFSLTSPIGFVVPPPPAVPEPSSLILLGTGLLGSVGAMRRRSKA